MWCERGLALAVGDGGGVGNEYCRGGSEGRELKGGGLKATHDGRCFSLGTRALMNRDAAET